MLRVRFILIGEVNTTFVNNLIALFNPLQDAFSFNIDPQRVIIDLQPENGFYDEDEIDAQCASISRRRHLGEYPVGICDLPLRENLSASFDADSAVISINGWAEKFPDIPKDKLFAYHMVDVLLTRRLMIPPHYEVRACPSDYCDNYNDRILGIEKGEFCKECLSFIRQGMQIGAVPLREVAAVFRILDWVAGRRRVFVVMPFGGDFDSIYHDVVKPCVESYKWLCIRADEICQPSEIIDLIWEEIHRSSMVIADLTNRNPNVFYELGYAHALGRPTLLLCQNIDDVPFDLRHRQLIAYSKKDNGLKKLSGELKKYLSVI